MEMVTCNFNCRNYIIRYCSVVLMTSSFNCTNTVTLYCSAALMTHSLQLSLYYMVLQQGTGDFQFALPKSGTAVAQWLRCCATNRKVAGSIPAGVIGIFH